MKGLRIEKDLWEKFQNIKVLLNVLSGYFSNRMLMENVTPWEHTLEKYFAIGNSLKSKLTKSKSN